MFGDFIKAGPNKTTGPAEAVLESGAAKTEEILKTPQQKDFFFISKNLILTRKKHCGESCCYNTDKGRMY